ncbi:MAG: hypothetical protein NTY74_04780 [Ignavibacteriae bacterium]|nr:hypothetical protein [Ignavibacteriota bacterium]
MNTQDKELDLKLAEKQFGWKISDGDYIRRKPEGKVEKFLKQFKVSPIEKISKIIKHNN